MKTSLLTLNFIALIVLTSCNSKKENTLDYKFNNEVNVVNCKAKDSLLLQEAIYEFEENLQNAFNKNKQNASRTYTLFLNQIKQNNLPITEFATAHSLKIAKALNASEIFKNGTLNYNSDVANCLFNNIKDRNLKITLNALKSTNSLRDNVVISTFYNEARNFYNDKHFASLLALRYYYPKLINLEETDLISKLDTSPQNEAINFNKTPNNKKAPINKTVQPGHEGHNH